MSRIIYRVARNPGDYKQCHDLMTQERMEAVRVSFPTIMALEDLKLVGFIGTRVIKKMVVAGPMVLDSSRKRIFTALRLVEAYDTAMNSLKMKSVIFYVDTDSVIYKMIERWKPDMTPYAFRDGKAFYTWKVGEDGRRRSERTSALG